MARPGEPKPPVAWTPPGGKHDWARPGANFGPDISINRGNIFAGDFRGAFNDFGGGWSGLSAAASDLKGLYDREYARDLLNRWPWWSGGGSASGGYGAYDSGYSNPYSTSYSGYSNPYATSDSGYSSPYSTSESGSTAPYSTQAEERSDVGASVEAQERNDSQSSAASRTDEAASSAAEPTAARECMKKAVLAFQQEDYAGAQNQCEEAIRLVPGNANMREFLALCQFAQGKHNDAAATLYAVLAGGPGWDWKTLISFYTNAETYTRQLRALEGHVKAHSTEAGGRFVLAYHYLVLDEREAACGQLRQVVTLQPRDQVSSGILKTLEKASAGQDQSAAERPAPER